jgi:hypothetical protein
MLQCVGCALTRLAMLRMALLEGEQNVKINKALGLIAMLIYSLIFI